MRDMKQIEFIWTFNKFITRLCAVLSELSVVTKFYSRISFYPSNLGSNSNHLLRWKKGDISGRVHRRIHKPADLTDRWRQIVKEETNYPKRILGPSKSLTFSSNTTL
jgi:hypothetical protein